MAEIAFEHVSKRFDDGTLAVDDLTLAVADGEFLILVGPSGCGKSTALRSVAGLEQVSEGEIRIDGHVVNAVAPPDRDVAMVFQSYALYPHLTVERNIAFPLRMARVDGAEQRRRVQEAARLLDIEDLLHRKPGELSGGQRQRVAMGRAIVRQPRAFLMDEPLSNLDAKLRVQMRAELVNLHRRLGVTTLYVTHDQVEAMTLGDRVAVMRKGVMQQVDTPRRLYRAPRNAYVAGFVGSPQMNFVRAVVAQGALRLGSYELHAPSHWPGEAGDVLLGVRPEALEPGPAPEGSGALQFDATVTMLEDLGSEQIVSLRSDVAQPAELTERPVELRGTLAMRAPARARIVLDERVTVHAALDELHLFDPATEEALAHAREEAAVA
jgi:multiple sugar transport system ATP-binding protein